jgi:hypothetical protein
MSEAVFVCRERDAACAEVPVGLRCATCSLGGKLEIASNPLGATPGICDADLLDWIARQAEEFTSGVLVDQPGDGDYFVYGMGGAYGQGKTFREAVLTAMAGVLPMDASGVDSTRGGEQ